MERSVRFIDIAKYAALLFLLQFVLGVASGFFGGDRVPDAWLSLIMSTALFAALTSRNSCRPLRDAAAVLLLYLVLELLLGLLVVPFRGMPPLREFALEWMILLLGPLFGVIIGVAIQRGRGQRQQQGIG
jgi:hypothetical protein